MSTLISPLETPQRPATDGPQASEWSRFWTTLSAEWREQKLYFLFRVGVFGGFHLATAILVALAGLPTLGALALCLGFYYLRMFGVTAGYHRYFAHRTFKTSRIGQFLLGCLAITSLQKGVLWWAAHHRHHHRYSDFDNDVHSPVRHGFFWAHVGWMLTAQSTATRYDQVKDLAKYPELRLINSLGVGSLLFAAICVAVYQLWGFNALVYGCFVSTVFLWHGTFTINSLAHVWGKRVYETSDDSRNNFVLALITMGEGWHNNHHYYQTSAAQGFHWWQLDATWGILWLLERVGLIWDMRRVPQEVIAGRLGGRDWRVRRA